MPIAHAVLDPALEQALQHAADRIAPKALDRLSGILAFGRCYRVPAPARCADLLIATKEAPHSLLKRLAEPVREHRLLEHVRVDAVTAVSGIRVVSGELLANLHVHPR